MMIDVMKCVTHLVESYLSSFAFENTRDVVAWVTKGQSVGCGGGIIWDIYGKIIIR